MKTQEASATTLSPHGTLTDFYPAAGARARFVNVLFDRAAADYDWLSGVLAFGTDRLYRRRALKLSGLQPGMRVLDVATGTGLVAKAALDLGIAPGHVIGLDPSRGMLARNGKRNGIPLLEGLAEDLPFRDGTFDFVVMGYALRHVEDLGRLFAEFHRVLHAPGNVLILEISRPRSRIGFRLMRFYMGTLLPWLIRMGGGRRETARLMEYYWATIAECVPPGSILSTLSGAGFKPIARKVRAGMLSEYRATKM